jgi:uncharacterized protein involved in exopolysaccharide biosynthesis
MNEESYSGWDPVNDPQYVQHLLPFLARKYCWLIVICFLLGGLITGVASLFLTPQYHSAGSIQFAGGNTPANRLSSILMTSWNSELEDKSLTVRSREIGQQVIDELGLQVKVYDLQGPDAPFERLRRVVVRGDRQNRRDEFTRLTIEDADVSEDLLRAKEIILTADADGNWSALGMSGEAGETLATSAFSFTPVFGPGHRAGNRYRLIVLPEATLWQEYFNALTAGPASGNAVSTLAVRFDYHNPVVAQQVVQLILDKFLELKQEQTYGATDTMLSFIRAEIDKAEGEVDRLAQELSELQEETGVYSVEDQVRVELQALIELAGQRTTKQIEIKKLDYFDSLITSETFLRTGDFDQLVDVSPELQGSFGTIGELAVQLAAMREAKTDEHPDVKALKAEIELAVERTAEHLKARRKSATIELGLLERDISKYSQMLEDSPLAGGKVELLKAEMQMQQQVLTTYRQQEATSMVQRAGTNLEMNLLDRAYFPTRRDSPRVKFNAILGAISAPLFISVILILLEVRTRRFRSLRELRLGTGLKMLTVIQDRPEKGPWAPGDYDPGHVRRLTRYLSAGTSTIGIVHLAGLAGGFDMAWMLGGALAGSGQRVLLVDADPVGEELANWCDLPQLPALTEVAGQGGEPTAAAHVIDEKRAIARLGSQAVTTEQLDALLGEMRRTYCAVVVCLPAPQAWTPQAAEIAPPNLVLSLPQGYCSLDEVRRVRASAKEHSRNIDSVVVTDYSRQRDYLSNEELRFVIISPGR